MPQRLILGKKVLCYSKKYIRGCIKRSLSVQLSKLYDLQLFSKNMDLSRGHYPECVVSVSRNIVLVYFKGFLFNIFCLIIISCFIAQTKTQYLYLNNECWYWLIFLFKPYHSRLLQNFFRTLKLLFFCGVSGQVFSCLLY